MALCEAIERFQQMWQLGDVAPVLNYAGWQRLAGSAKGL